MPEDRGKKRKARPTVMRRIDALNAIPPTAIVETQLREPQPLK